MRAARCLAAGLLVACGPDAGERVELAPLCGTERAVQVLALRDDEAVAPGDETVVVRDGALPWQTDEVVYQVRALGSGRTGLWRVRFD